MKEEIWVVKGRSLLDNYLDNTWVGDLMILMMGLRVLYFLRNLGSPKKMRVEYCAEEATFLGLYLGKKI